LRERGFNQALELARLIAAQLNIPVDYSLCQRDKATPFQSGLSARQRKRNLKNAFSMTKTVPYKHVAIFDDVVTTGTTVNELAKKLKQSGVQIVEVWAIARTEPKK
jgi:ComF family protein